MTNHHSIIPRAPREDPTISHMVLDVADHSSLGDRPDGKDISDDERGLLSTVDELTRVHPLGGDEELVLLLVAEGVTE